MNKPLDTMPEATISHEEERALAVRIQKSGDAEALEKLVLNNMRQAVCYARKVCRGIFDDGELISVCYNALHRQAKRYNPTSALQFFTFAKIGVRGDVNRAFKTLDTIKNLKRVQTADWAEFSENLPEQTETSTTRRLEQVDEARFIMQIAARCCTKKERAVLELAYYGGLGFHEIARLFGISRSAVQASHARAVEKVRHECRKTERGLFSEDSRA